MAEATGIKKLVNSDLLLIVGVIGILAVMIIPMPPMMLDILLILSITLSLLILFVSLYTIKPLDFSIFPTTLLISTLFRLSLNVASTRLILLNGNKGASGGAAGAVISAFGDTVVGGQYVVGIIIFLILVLINFIVITKGAGRIAEVAARFTLDAMPGKQMAIDADLNAGIIDEGVAKLRRTTIQRESDFFGAMDGASKFVRGDAIAGLIITGINILGGLIIGVLIHDMPIGDAAKSYTMLTVGDGLVSQIPALIISTAAGITVSKAGAENRLGADFGTQLFGNYRALGLVSICLFLFIFVDGMPKTIFLILSIILGSVAWIGYQKEQTEQGETDHLKEVEEAEALTESNEDIESLLPIDLLGLELGYALIPLVDPDQDGELLERVKAIRRQIALDMGFVVPPVHIKDNLQLEPGEYSIIIKGIEVGKGEMMLEHFLAMKAGDVDEEIDGIPTVEPAFGLPAVWIPNSEQERAQIAGYTVVDVPTVISTHLTEIIKANAYEFLGRQEVQNLLDGFAKHEPKVVEELIPDLLGLGVVQRVLQNLLRENVSIRDLHSLLETLADSAPFTKDPDLLTEHIRQNLARNITRQYQNDEGILPVMTLDQEIENLISNAIHETSQGSYLGLDPSVAQAIISLIEKGIENFNMFNYQPLVLCSPMVRPHLKKLTERFIPNLVVLSHNEVAQDARIESLGTIEYVT
ncbi:MAG: flagellar biosynthesis protein FlhA [bacterium]|jgi:flagellar biosynthesis protein FlhA